MNCENNLDLSIIQHNTARGTANMHTCLEIGFRMKIDFICIQEPWVSRDNAYTVTHSAYQAILPENRQIRPRAMIFALKNSKYQYCYRPDLCQDSDIIIIDILKNGIPELQLINIYNEKSLEENCNEWTIQRALRQLIPSKNALICGDFNAHHIWWNLESSNARNHEGLIEWLNQFDFELLNEPDIPTFFRQNLINKSVIDLAFATKTLNQKRSIT